MHEDVHVLLQRGPLLGGVDAGADVAVAARRADRLEAVAARVRAAGRRCVAVPTDVTVAADCAALVDTAVGELGRVDVLVHAVGTGYAARAEQDDPARVGALITTNLTGAHHVASAAGRAMIAGGRGGSGSPATSPCSGRAGTASGSTRSPPGSPRPR